MKHLGSKETNIENKEPKQLDMVNLLPANVALEEIALKICMAASEPVTNGSLKMCNRAVPALHLRDLAEFFDYLGKLINRITLHQTSNLNLTRLHPRSTSNSNWSVS